MIKNKLKIILCSAIIGGSIIGFYHPIVNAAPTEKDVTIEIQKLDNDLSNLTIKLNDNKDKNSRLVNEIKQNEKFIQNKKEEIKETENMLNAQMRDYYIENDSNSNNALVLLLSSENMSDFLNKAKIMKIVLEEGNTTIKTLEKDKQDIIKTNEKLSKDKKEIEKNTSSIKNDIKTIDDKKKELKVKLEELNKAKINNASNTNSIIAQQNHAEYNDFLKTGPVVNSKNDIGNSVVNLATKFLGVPYVWGGTTPQGFDCSGLVLYCYNAYGISLPRVSQEQQQVGIDVLLSQAKAGDLVFFHGYPATHVGIYMGNGYYIHAPHTGDVVKISPLGDYTNIKRIIS
ncbi:hydrolase [Clostridium sporogenes]